MRIIKFTLFIILACSIHTSCSTSYIKAMQFGEVSSETFTEDVHVEVTNQLIIVPVTIKGETYRFLFDTGAPFSVSKELHEAFQFKRINKSVLTDSDKSKSSLEIVQVDSLNIGNISFTNQTAFVGDFKQNAVIKCLDIDGIVGSNLMKHCNWSIDMQNEIITLSKGEKQPLQQISTTIPFRKNNQYDIILDLQVGETILPNVKLDYGSNGSLTLPEKTFSTLKANEFKSSLTLNGFVQHGLFGVRKPFTSELVKADSLWIEDLFVEDVIIKLGKSKLLGGKVLTNYIVSINWDNQTVSFAKNKNHYSFENTFGFKVGYTDKLVVQSVLEHTEAEEVGLKPNMEILKVDELDFTSSHNLCDYMHHFKQERHSLHVVYKTLEGERKSVIITKKSPF